MNKEAKRKRNKEVTPEFDGYLEKKFYTLNFGCYTRDSKAKNTQALIKARRGSGADMCPDHTASAPTPRSGGDPMLPRGLLPVT
jgi:hypothetical protein